MYKTIIMGIFIAFMVGVIFLATNLKDAYKVLPGSTTPTMTIDPHASWRDFSPQSGGFKVLFPAVPQFAKEAVNIPNTDKKRRYEMYASETINGTVFMVSVITYPQDYDTVNKTQTVQSVVDELVASDPANHLLESRDAVFLGFPAVDFHMVNKEFDIEGKSFMNDKTVYVLTYVARNKDYNREDYDYFINSFHLNSQDSNKN